MQKDASKLASKPSYNMLLLSLLLACSSSEEKSKEIKSNFNLNAPSLDLSFIQGSENLSSREKELIEIARQDNNWNLGERDFSDTYEKVRDRSLSELYQASFEDRSRAIPKIFIYEEIVRVFGSSLSAEEKNDLTQIIFIYTSHTPLSEAVALVKTLYGLYQVYKELGPGYQKKHFWAAARVSVIVYDAKGVNQSFQTQYHKPITPSFSDDMDFFLSQVQSGAILVNSYTSEEIKQVLGISATSPYTFATYSPNFESTSKSHIFLVEAPPTTESTTLQETVIHETYHAVQDKLKRGGISFLEREMGTILLSDPNNLGAYNIEQLYGIGLLGAEAFDKRYKDAEKKNITKNNEAHVRYQEILKGEIINPGEKLYIKGLSFLLEEWKKESEIGTLLGQALHQVTQHLLLGSINHTKLDQLHQTAKQAFVFQRRLTLVFSSIQMFNSEISNYPPGSSNQAIIKNLKQDQATIKISLAKADGEAYVQYQMDLSVGKFFQIGYEKGFDAATAYFNQEVIPQLRDPIYPVDFKR